MTREEIQKLSNWQINLRIHEVLGCTSGPLPDYMNDMRMLRVAEKTLTPEQWDEYAKNLSSTCSLPEGFEAPVWDEFTLRTGIAIGLKYALTAAPRQRAEALLMVLTEQPL